MSDSLSDIAARKQEKDALEERIQALSGMIRAAAPGEEVLPLAERCDSLLRLAALLRSISAADSEAWPVNGLDPTHLAMLALKDAKRGIAINAQNPAFHRRKGEAHNSLEQYDAAREAFLEALSLDMGDAKAAAGLRAATAGGEASDAAAQQSPTSPASPAAAPPKRQRTAARGDPDDWECPLCLKLLWEPVATPCAHMFCRPCFQRACDHSSKCPSCRTVLHVGRAIPVLTQVLRFLTKAFPEEYAARSAEEAVVPSTEGDAPLPLFVMSSMLPGERMRLHIFEPRYRLLVRRAMEGSRRLGMIAPGPARTVAAVGAECEITECQPLPDGRFYLEVAATGRFRVVREWELDGYRMAVPERLQDSPPPEPNAAASEELAELAKAVEADADAWIARLGAMGATRLGARAAELVERAGPKPPPGPPESRAEALSFWAACLLPMAPAEQQTLLDMTDSAERLRLVKAEFDRLTGDGPCNMM